MADYLNLPNEDNQKRIADSLERIAGESESKITDYTGSPGPKVLVAGDRDRGFYGFVQPREFGLLLDNEVSKQQFNGVNLALAIGLAQGTAQFSDTAWMKFSWDGEIIFVPVKAIRRTVSWDRIYNQGAVYGDGSIGVTPPTGRTGRRLSVDGGGNAFVIEEIESHFRHASSTTAKAGDTLVARGFDNEENNGEFEVLSVTDTQIFVDADLKSEDGNKKASVHNKGKEVKQDAKVKIGNLNFAVELLSVAANDPLDSYADSDRGMVGAASQWNGLILPLHEQAKLGNWTYKAYAGEVEDWGAGLTDLDLMTHHTLGTGSLTWGKETSDSEPMRRARRGINGASDGAARAAWGGAPLDGWRPALRFLPS